MHSKQVKYDIFSLDHIHSVENHNFSGLTRFSAQLNKYKNFRSDII